MRSISYLFYFNCGWPQNKSSYLDHDHDHVCMHHIFVLFVGICLNANRKKKNCLTSNPKYDRSVFVQTNLPVTFLLIKQRSGDKNGMRKKITISKFNIWFIFCVNLDFFLFCWSSKIKMVSYVNIKYITSFFFRNFKNSLVIRQSIWINSADFVVNIIELNF